MAFDLLSGMSGGRDWSRGASVDAPSRATWARAGMLWGGIFTVAAAGGFFLLREPKPKHVVNRDRHPTLFIVPSRSGKVNVSVRGDR